MKHLKIKRGNVGDQRKIIHQAHPKKHKGRHKNKRVDEESSAAICAEVSSNEDVLDFRFKERTTGKKVYRGLSNSDYVTEKLESEDDMSNDYSYDYGKRK
ncbi:hypothetical protein RYX36_020668 [Vicia faba]